VKRRVTEGYGILQPRVAISLPGTNRSRYARLYGGEPGIDPYTRGSLGCLPGRVRRRLVHRQGDLRRRCLRAGAWRRFPENRILSHDLLEGCYARAGLLSDVQLYEDYPARYSADVSRRYRWIRGDWQLAGWLLAACCGGVADTRGRGAGRVNCRQQNPLSQLSQWKLIDNLRRSLVPAALTLLLLLGWTLLSRRPGHGPWR
jgi:cyclic beta-1,2-glucan synthetase